MARRRPLRAVAGALLAAGLAGGLAQAQPQPAPAPLTPPPPVEPATPIQPSEPLPPPTPSSPAPLPEATFTPPTPAPVEEDEVEREPAKASAPPKPAEPMKRVRSDAAILQVLDKVTAETLRFEAPVGQPVRYKSLVFTVRACEMAAPDEAAPEAAVYVAITSQPRAQPGRATPAPRQVFRGWMFASSPSLNPLEHPVYDAWAIACRTSAPPPAKR